MKKIFCCPALELFHCLLPLFCCLLLWTTEQCGYMEKAYKMQQNRNLSAILFYQYNRSGEKVAQPADPLPSILHAYLVSQLACFNNSHFPGRCALRVSSCHTQLVSVILLPACLPARVRPRFFDQVGHETMYASIEMSIFSLNHVIFRFTKIMNNLLEHLKICTFKVIFMC